MKERKWMGHDWQPTVSDPEREVSANEAKDIYLQLLNQKLKERVDAGEISQAEMDEAFIKVGFNLPSSHLFPQEDVRMYGIDKVTIKKSSLELCAEIMANAVKADSGNEERKNFTKDSGNNIN